MAQTCFAWSLWNDCGTQPEPQAVLSVCVVDWKLAVHSGCTNPTGFSLHRHNEKERNNLIWMYRCLCFQVSEWSHKSKWKSRGERGGELLLRERFFSVCVSLNCIYVCRSSSSTHSRPSFNSRNSPWSKSLLCVDKKPKFVRWRPN